MAGLVRLTLLLLLISFWPGGAQAADGVALSADKMNLRNMGLGRLSYALIHAPGLPEGSFVLRFSVQGVQMTGCPALRNLSHEESFQDIYLTIRLIPPRADTTDLPTAPHLSCGGHVQNPTADIVLSKDMLRAHGARHIMLENGPVMSYLDIHLQDDRVTIRPSETLPSRAGAFSPLKQEGVADPGTLWFYPPGTIMLYSPEATDAHETDSLIRELALRNGIVPLAAYLPDFKAPLARRHAGYYVDKTERYAGHGAPVAVGTITVPEKTYGLEGDRWTSRTLTVYARDLTAYE
ncbi:MAG: hypothetical protein KDJ15_01735 [Alphaproteobacteria bacterium]|nr:hypothetical protein [Alphaproteobacteria bacterium]